MEPFSIRDYWKMYKAKGIRLPLSYFFHAHLFDLLRGTDTHNWLRKENLDNGLDQEPHGQVYMVSWTKEIREAFRQLHARLGTGLGDYAFVDIGCGKGKTCLVWASMARKAGLDPVIAGLDHSPYLIGIARANRARVKGAGAIRFEECDVRQFDYRSLGSKFIFYLYNPFDAVLLEEFAEVIAPLDHLIVYVHPDAVQVLKARGYETVWMRDSWHHSDRIMILAPPGAGSKPVLEEVARAG